MNKLFQRMNSLAKWQLFTGLFFIIAYAVMLYFAAFYPICGIFEWFNKFDSLFDYFDETFELIIFPWLAGWGILYLLVLAVNVKYILFLQELWRENHPDKISRLPQFFYFGLFPIIGWVFLHLVLGVNAWRRSRWLAWWAFIGLAAPGAGAVAAWIYWCDFFSVCLLNYYFIWSWGALLLLLPKSTGQSYSGGMKKFLWSTLSLGVLSLALAHGVLAYKVSQLEVIKADLRTKNVPLNFAELGRYYCADGPGNQELMGRIKNMAAKNFMYPNNYYILRADEFEHVEKLLRDKADIIREMDEIANLNPNKYYFNFTVNIASEFLYGLNYARDYARLNAVRLQLAAKNGDRETLMEVLRCSNRHSEMIGDVPFLIYGLVYQSMIKNIYDGLAVAMHRGILTEADLLEIRNSARQSQELYQQKFENYFRGEVAFLQLLGDIELAFAEARGDILFTPKNIQWQKIFFKYAPLNPMLLLAKCWLKNEGLLLYRNWDNFYTAAQASEADFVQLKSRLNWPEDGEDLNNHGIIELMIFPGFVAAIKNMQMSYDRMQMLQLACEVELFKLKNQRLPRNLEELQLPELPVDSFRHQLYIFKIGSWRDSDKELIYDGYRIYSAGVNGIDEDGYRDNLSDGSRDDIAVTVAEIKMTPLDGKTPAAKDETAEDEANKDA
ncbi:MAG: hypothetical protein RRY34_03965, partial [Victivallaceae bacterium]